MARKGENIYKRKDGRWEGRYIKGHEQGKTKYGYVYAHGYLEAKKKLCAAKNEYEKSKKHKDAESVKLAAISKEWIAEGSKYLKETTLIKYEDLLRCYILPEFGDCDLSRITNEQLLNFSNVLLLKGGKKNQGLSASTVTEIFSTLNSIRIYALQKNYAVNFSPECVKIKQQHSAPRIRVFSIDEERRLIQYLCSHINLTSLAILLCLFTGIRIGEVCALKWDDFDMTEGNFCIDKTMQRLRGRNNSTRKTTVQIFKPKSFCSERTIPFPKKLNPLLLEYYQPGTYLLTGSAEKYIEPRTLMYRYKKILTECGISDANFHATRHTFATRCVEMGFDIKCLTEILGHASVSITLNRYVHPAMSLKEKNMQKLSGLLPTEEPGQ